MKTIQLTSPDSNHVQVSAMGVTEGARRAPGVAAMAGGRDSFVSPAAGSGSSRKKATP